MEKLVNFLVLGITLSSVQAVYVETVAQVAVETGRSLYLPVKRELLAKLMRKAEGPTLYLPQGTVLDDQPAGTHPLRIDIAEVTLTNFVEDQANSGVSTGVEVTVSIPFLSVTPNGPIDYSLGLAVLYDQNRPRPFPKSGLLYMYVPVQQLTLDPSGLDIESEGANLLQVEFLASKQCNIETVVAKRGLTKSRGDTTYTFTMDGFGNLWNCDEISVEDSQFCSTVKNILRPVFDSSPNTCLVVKSDDERHCTFSAKAASTGWMKHLVPIDGPTPTIFAEMYSGNYRVGIKFPCVDN